MTKKSPQEIAREIFSQYYMENDLCFHIAQAIEQERAQLIEWPSEDEVFNRYNCPMENDNSWMIKRYMECYQWLKSAVKLKPRVVSLKDIEELCLKTFDLHNHPQNSWEVVKGYEWRLIQTWKKGFEAACAMLGVKVSE